MRVLAAADFASLRARLPREIERLRAGEPLRPVTIVVPTDLAREETRRDLAERTGGTIGIRVRAWSEWVGEQARAVLAGGERRLSEPGFELLVGRIARGAFRGGPFAEATRTPGLARALAATLADLLEGGYTPEALERARPLLADPVRSALRRAMRALEQALEEEALLDRRREEGIAAGALARRAAPGEESLLFAGFHDLTPRQRSVVLAAAAHRPVVLLVPGPGGAGGAAAEPLLAWARSHGAEVATAETAGAPLLALREEIPGGVALADPGPEQLVLRAHACESDEVRSIARSIRREVLARGRSFEEFLVTVAPSGPPPILVRRIFAKAAIPLADRAGVPLARTPDGRRAILLARALAAQPRAPEHEALEFLGAAPAEARARAGGDAAETAERFREEHERRFRARPAPEIDAALEALALAYGSSRLAWGEFARALAAALARAPVRDPVVAPDGSARVLLLRIDQARGVRRPLVYHAGLVEGALRRVPREDPLLPDAFRQALNDRFEHEGLHVRVREEARVESTLLARFALESATEGAVLSWARRPRPGSEERAPAEWLLDLAEARAGEPLDAEGRVLARVAPPDPPAEARAAPVDPTDADLALLLAGGAPAEEDLARLLAEERAERLPHALHACEERWRAGALTAYDGVLDDERAVEAVRALLDAPGRRWSPTALERLANCPFAFLVHQVLRLAPAEEPSEDFDARERGALFHRLMERVYRGLEREGLLPLAPHRLKRVLALLDGIVEQERSRLDAQPPERRAPRRTTLDVMREDVAAVLAAEALADPAERTQPVHLEFAFGEDERTAPRIALEGAIELPLRGRADRVDRRADGALEIVDFKTGAPSLRPGKVARTRGGRVTVALQLPLYLEAVGAALGEPIARALFHHATADHGFERVPFTAQDLARVRPWLARLLRAGIERARTGWFPPRPGPEGCSCDLEPACGPAAAARFARKRSDPQLAAHLALLAEAGAPPAPQEEEP